MTGLDENLKEIDGELRVYKAILYKTMGPNDDRLQVRIVPYMLDIPNDELDYLPIYPSLIKGKVFAGYSEIDDGKEKALRLFVAATPDFSYGYVIGPANDFEGNNKEQFSGSYNFSQIKRYLSQRSACPSDFEYKDIEVLISSHEENTGGVMVLHNIRTGDFFIINDTGSMFTVQRDKVYIRVGSPSDPPGGNNPFSALTMTADKVVLDTPVFDVRAKSCIFGHKGLYLCGTNSEVSVPVEQVSIVPLKNIAG